MNLLRREFLQFAATTAFLTAASRGAWSGSYPIRPVRMLVGFPAGSTSDLVARLIGQRLSQRLGQPFVIENHPGASGNIATEEAVRAEPDGYTLLLVGSNNAINATLFAKLKYNFIHDITPIASIWRAPGVMEVNPSVPVKTVPDFISYVKAHPGQITMASAGNGSILHMYGALFMTMTGINLLDVPYRGAPPALTDLLSGRVQVMFDNLPTSLGYIRAGKLRPLAVTTATAVDVLADVPPLADSVPGYEASLWQGVGTPKDTPAEVISLLNQEINLALADTTIKGQLSQLGGVPLGGSPSEFGKLIAADTEKWAKVIRAAGIKEG